MMIFILNDFMQKYSEMKIITLFTNKRLYGLYGLQICVQHFSTFKFGKCLHTYCETHYWVVLWLRSSVFCSFYNAKPKTISVPTWKKRDENFIVSNIDMERFSVCSLGNSGSSGSTMSSVWLINDDSYGWRLSAISSSRLEIPNVPYCFDSHDLQKFN